MRGALVPLSVAALVLVGCGAKEDAGFQSSATPKEGAAGAGMTATGVGPVPNAMGGEDKGHGR